MKFKVGDKVVVGGELGVISNVNYGVLWKGALYGVEHSNYYSYDVKEKDIRHYSQKFHMGETVWYKNELHIVMCTSGNLYDVRDLNTGREYSRLRQDELKEYRKGFVKEKSPEQSIHEEVRALFDKWADRGIYIERAYVAYSFNTMGDAPDIDRIKIDTTTR